MGGRRIAASQVPSANGMCQLPPEAELAAADFGMLM